MPATEPRPPLLLSVNVDHVATLRQARRVSYPDPVEAAALAEAAGAQGITVHLRGDRRHVQDRDVERLATSVRGKLNLEIAATDEMTERALAAAKLRQERGDRAFQVTLVPERPDEVTTEGGLDLLSHGARIEATARRLDAAGAAVSLFLDPSEDQVRAAADLPRNLVAGFEINTDAFTAAAGPDGGGDAGAELEAVRRAAALGAERGLAVYAGHGLTTGNVGPVAAVPEIEELNIGHYLVSRAALVGLERAIGEMLEAMAEGRGGEG